MWKCYIGLSYKYALQRDGITLLITEQIFTKLKKKNHPPFLETCVQVFPGAEQQDFPGPQRGGRQPRSHADPGERQGHGSGSPWRQALPAPPAGGLWLRHPAGVRAAVLQLRDRRWQTASSAALLASGTA